MQYLLTLTFFLFVHVALAQLLEVRVVDMQSGAPVRQAKLDARQQVAYSDPEGKGALTAVQLGDSLHIEAVGYEKMTVVITDLTNALIVRLTRLPIQLEDVVITRPRLTGVDTTSWRRSLERRLAKQALRERQMGIFVDKGNTAGYWPSHRASSSSASIVTLNVGKLIGLLAKKKDKQVPKLSWSEDQQLLVNAYFNAAFVQQLTGLSGESLSLFLSRFQPDPQTLPNVSEYSIVAYIKKSFYEFQSASESP